MFVELGARTHFSFLRGASSPKALVQRAVDLGHDTLGIADCDGLYGMVRALEAAEEAGIRLVVGCEVALDDCPLDFVWLHVATGEGYKNLCRVLTKSHERHPKGKPRTTISAETARPVARNQFAGATLDLVRECSAGLYCLAPVSAARGSRPGHEVVAGGAESVARLKEAFGGRLSIAAWRHLDGEDDVRLGRVGALSRELDVPVCATNRVLYAVREDKPVYDVLHCIREAVTLDEAGRALLPNAEAHLKSGRQMAELFADHPAWLARTRDVADACRFSMREIAYRFPSDGFVEGGEAPDAALRRLTYEGARKRFPLGLSDAVRAQIEKELALVAELQVAPYFLSVQSIVQMARRRDILCQGRGSAANSAVCFCLGITAVDPARSSMLFERFLSIERREPPDIDVDFEHSRREEVIQEIYETYGRNRAAMVSEIISYRGKSALREVGKVFGLSLEQVDRLGDLVSWWDKLDDIPPERTRACGFDVEDVRVRQVLAMAHAIQGFPRHLSIHVGGFVLSAEPLDAVAPVEPATMPRRTVIPWDKDDLDTLRFFKVDVLGLGMLTAIRKGLDMAACEMAAAPASAIDRLAAIPPEDPRVYDALCAADTVGVFQIESRAQMAMLPRLRPREFYDLVVEVAIVRPGPIQGGMVHPYLRRRTGEEPISLPHPILAPILERTLGVPLFQEQVMQLAIVGAGYTGGEADQLRRDMAAWRRTGKLERHRERLLEGFERRGIAREFGERLFESIKGFGEYGFPESHAASFAHLVYASAWLKVHHPAAFAAALINSQPMGFYSPGTIVKDAERHGVEVLPVRIDASDWDCTLEGGDRRFDGDPPALRLGLRLVRGLGEESGRRIEIARRERPFASVEDLRARGRLDKREVESLAQAGALTSFGLGRRESMWKVRAPRETDLLAGVELCDPMPDLPPLSHAEQLALDYESVGVAVGDHAMNVVRKSLPSHFKTSRDLSRTPHGAIVSTAGLVICRQRPQTASGVVFVTLEDEVGFVNLILWTRTFERWRHVATTSSMLVAHGKVERQGDVVYVVPERLERLTMYDVPSMSRDFR
ncbi:MAG TPA: error-prone DNA polymerase [Polyangiaceae bacterium]|nr:error-prone DNA polymerase [Polyangiaceae bacterium]